MINRRKSSKCPNCGLTLDNVYNFCPRCGQENNTPNVSFGKLFKEFFVNYFALDSRFTKSIKPFLLKPGELSNHFNEGKRRAYVNPIRLYLILNLFFFFIFRMSSPDVFGDQDRDQSGIINVTKTLPRLKGMEEPTRKAINQALSNDEIDLIGNRMQDNSLPDFVEALDEQHRKKLVESLPEGMYDEMMAVYDSLKISPQITVEESEQDSVSSPDTNKSFFEKVDFTQFKKLAANRSLSDEEVYDSLMVENASYFEEKLLHQLIRVERADNQSVRAYIISNLPIMMFLVLPIHALMLKLLYVRRKVLYIKHLIHALHLHSFSYLVFGLIFLFLMFLPASFNNISLLIGNILVGVYVFISFLKVYKQKWFKTLVKLLLLSGAYVLILSAFMIAEMIISLLLF